MAEYIIIAFHSKYDVQPGVIGLSFRNHKSHIHILTNKNDKIGGTSIFKLN